MQRGQAARHAEFDIVNLIDAVPHGVMLLDHRRRVITLNRFLEALIGYSRDDVAGVKGEYVIRASLKMEDAAVAKILASEENVSVEGDIISQNRRRTPVRFNVSPLKTVTGDTHGSILVLEDISLLKDLGNKVHGFSGQEKIIGHSLKMQEIFELIPIAARTDTTVLVTGETGTGKDLVAEAIHRASKRTRHPFIKVNCGALPESLLESELFGHVRGAFTGADKDKPGMFRLANGGTIFLTEIGDLPLSLQVKLLTVLDDKEFFPVGGSKKEKVDVRIVAATHRNLGERVRAGMFREDLYYRLNVLRIHIPPLRERADDIRLLLDHFLVAFKKNLNKNIIGFSDETMQMLSNYAFPGNVRELRNIVEYAVNICPGGTVLPEHLPGLMTAVPQESFHSRPNLPPRNGGNGLSGAEWPAVPSRGGWGTMERAMILEALAKTGGNRSRAAETLGWSRSKLWRKIKQHRLE
ncbi:MAG TPA: sigma-54-dependent Fis family transcriptional regulator [Desulfobulbaceae bacterium]|nr:sigma-54-dependent Fis family transcriptional regulator [Desulfobulbaceae bacterium]